MSIFVKNIVQISELYEIYKNYPSVQTDTRKIKKDDLFFALKGPNYNGNLFAQQALDLGAAYAIVDEPLTSNNNRIILMDNVLTTLQQLAKYHRDQLHIPIIAITGSNGKTTSKELIHAVLSSHFKTYTTQGNLNNQIGLPLTVLGIKKEDAEMAVLEMGANHQKEIDRYCAYALPTYGVITNCGKAHLEGFGGIEGVRKGKGELYDYLAKTDGTAFINADLDYLLPMSTHIKNKIFYGESDGIVQGSIFANEPFLQVKITSGLSIDQINTQLVGDYNLPNVLCAAAIGKHFGVPDEKIKNAIEQYDPSNSRSQLIEQGSNRIILDAYNANPSSMKAAIENFASIKGDNKVLLLGAMMELGEESIAEHESLITLIQQFPWQTVVLVGGDFGNINHPYLYFENAALAKEWYEAQNFSNTHFLVKGSRSFKMETVMEKHEA
jgi:UDP-N-acetylmuramoyl-tripeptide--D-alanyl-D-alanine ligase